MRYISIVLLIIFLVIPAQAIEKNKLRQIARETAKNVDANSQVYYITISIDLENVTLQEMADMEKELDRIFDDIQGRPSKIKIEFNQACPKSDTRIYWQNPSTQLPYIEIAPN